MMVFGSLLRSRSWSRVGLRRRTSLGSGPRGLLRLRPSLLLGLRPLLRSRLRGCLSLRLLPYLRLRRLPYLRLSLSYLGLRCLPYLRRGPALCLRLSWSLPLRLNLLSGATLHLRLYRPYLLLRPVLHLWLDWSYLRLNSVTGLDRRSCTALRRALALHSGPLLLCSVRHSPSGLWGSHARKSGRHLVVEGNRTSVDGDGGPPLILAVELRMIL
jgi:hypothetical protein